MVATPAQAQASAGPADNFKGLQGFDDKAAPSFAVAIVGDLHLEPGPQEPLFEEARRQLVGAVCEPGVAAPRVVQLGDLGGYKFRPGSRECFTRGREYLAGFGLPTTLVTGNHDLEGDEFETDEENLAAWQEAFRQKHYWAADVGPATFIGLSTVRFRSNPWSVHEVHVDEEQLQFFKEKLEAAQGRPVVVFTHAPILGSGLKVVQTVHVKNRCAWLNHSSDPHAFIELVQQYPNIRLWFSGHFHLSHNYADSISVVGGTAFVLTGVIGECNRDGFRHSRLLKGTEEGYELYTMDHDTGGLRLDLKHSWDDSSSPQPLMPEDELICDPAAGWLCSKVDCPVPDDAEFTPLDLSPPVTWLNAGPGCMLAVQDEIIVEYDTRSMSPIGVVCMDMPDDCTAVLRAADGSEVDAAKTDGSAAVALEVMVPDGELHQRIKRNQAGSFYQIYQHNKWVARKKKEAAEEAARSAAAVSAAR
ncbi:calcineurin-like phosphoesterase [Micractinium conductrix]|uniref:Calcineurin-like phosphoesterase n=1 Tax=Micractinium conductrix TaxID=554055 RepID=A0A2P6VND5_9CHLO|nr:calcineurin-like phosphoesterase [Micractinium conductrix]|eukprot:PSC75593.1 calcineurin-like phosphoesterase [Micractinium conductrix]